MEREDDVEDEYGEKDMRDVSPSLLSSASSPSADWYFLRMFRFREDLKLLEL